MQDVMRSCLTAFHHVDLRCLLGHELLEPIWWLLSQSCSCWTMQLRALRIRARGLQTRDFASCMKWFSMQHTVCWVYPNCKEMPHWWILMQTCSAQLNIRWGLSKYQVSCFQAHLYLIVHLWWLCHIMPAQIAALTFDAETCTQMVHQMGSLQV